MEHIVKNCNDCILRYNDDLNGNSCTHPLSTIRESELTQYGECGVPEKCPLKNCSLNIKVHKE